MKLYALLLTIISLASCGGKVDIDSFNLPNGVGIESILEQQDIDCGTDGCPDGVVRLIYEKERTSYSVEYGLCSGWLVDKDIVATNAHCLPYGEVTSNNIGCSDMLFAVSAKKNANGKHEYRKCAEIISAKEEDRNKGGRDYAFFRLEKDFDHSPIELSQQTLKHGDIHYAYVIQQESATEADFEKRMCTVSLQNEAVPFATSADSPILPFLCKNYKGNSGSVIVNDNLEAQAILSHIVGEKPVSIATNLECINSKPLFKRFSSSSKCSQSLGSLLSKTKEYYFPIEIKEQITKVLSSEERKIFEWDLDPESNIAYKSIKLMPVCVKKEAIDLFKNNATVVNLEFSQPVVERVLRFNSYNLELEDNSLRKVRAIEKMARLERNTSNVISGRIDFKDLKICP